MSRKYLQRGYQDDERDRDRDRDRAFDRRPPKGDGRPRRGYGPREPRAVNMPAFRDVLKCARCGAALESAAIGIDTQCSGCGADLHSCAQCTWFDTSLPRECAQPIPKRVAPKDARNDCTRFEARVTVERETHSTVAAGPGTDASRAGRPPASSPAAETARRAFDDLFK